KWEMARLWRRLAPLLVSQLEGHRRLVLDLDDILFHKAGRKVNRAGSFRDPIRSRGQRTVFAHVLNLVVLTLRVQPPWGGEPIGPRPDGLGSAAGPARRALASAPLPSSPLRPSTTGPSPTSTYAASKSSGLLGHDRCSGTPSVPSSRLCSPSSPTPPNVSTTT